MHGDPLQSQFARKAEDRVDQQAAEPAVAGLRTTYMDCKSPEARENVNGFGTRAVIARKAIPSTSPERTATRHR